MQLSVLTISNIYKINCHPLEVVGRDSETQPQVDDNLDKIYWWVNVAKGR